MPASYFGMRPWSIRQTDARTSSIAPFGVFGGFLVNRDNVNIARQPACLVSDSCLIPCLPAAFKPAHDIGNQRLCGDDSAGLHH